MGQEESQRIKNQIQTENKFPFLSKTLFDFLYVIGRGGFGKVWKVRYKRTQKKYALKEMSKVKIIDRKSEKSIKNEKEFLSKLHHPFLVNMICSFQDYDNLYLVMDLFTGGDLRYHICKKKKFTENQSKFIIGCVLTGLEYIHNNNIIHRDIKPENLVLDSNGYVAITDFGVAKINSKDNSSETSGTPGYMAPEVLCAQNHSFPVDFFAIGIMGFEFMNGYRPYLGRNRKEIKDAVLAKQAHIHRKDAIGLGWSVESCDFINRMVYRKPFKRLGFNGILEVKSHDWFKGFKWDELEKKNMKSYFIPKIGDNFDKKYCEGIEKIDTETKERYLYYMSKEMFKDLFFNYTFIKEEVLANHYEKKNEKIKFLNNSSVRNTTATSNKSPGNNNINNIYNKLKNYENHNNKSSNSNNTINPKFDFVASTLIKYLGNNNNNGNHNINNNKYSNIKHSSSASAIQIPMKYTSLNLYNNNNNSKRMINSPSLNINNISLNNDDINKDLLSKTLQNNKNNSNIKNKISPLSSHNLSANKINMNLNKPNLNISSYRNMNYTNIANKKSLYQYQNKGSNLSQTNFVNNLNNNIIKNNYYYNNINQNNNENIMEIKTARYNRINKEAIISNSNNSILSKNASMKLLNFNPAYLNNINIIQKLKYSNYRNNKLGSANHYNIKNNNSNKYILSQRARPISVNNPTYRKISNSGLNLIHHY